MPSEKRYKSICHSLTQHAVSGLSNLTPRIPRTIREQGLSFLRVNLIGETLCPENLELPISLYLTLTSLKQKFEEIIIKDGLSIDDVKEMMLVFELCKMLPDDSCLDCHATLTTKSGKVFQTNINSLGKYI
jgi:hypothetical protein